MDERAARPKKPDTVTPVKEIGLVLYPDDKAVGLQFQDGAGKQVFLWLPGSLLSDWGSNSAKSSWTIPRPRLGKRES
jgi:hypothetical protein